MVHFDKPQFHGRAALLRLKDMPERTRLVGFHLPACQLPSSEQARQLEGCQVVEGRVPVGRVTSARFAPVLEKLVGLAWVPAARAGVGDKFLIHHGDLDLPAVVTLTPFYDPFGDRLKN